MEYNNPLKAMQRYDIFLDFASKNGKTRKISGKKV